MTKVLIVGATSAIAEEIARIHARRGDTLALLARDAAALSRVATSLGNAVVWSEAGDFTETTANAGRIERAVAALGGIDVALLCHGWLGDQLQSEHDLAHAEQVVATNFTSAMSFVIDLANRFERAGRGSLVVISSVAGDRGRPRNYTYGAAKGALSIYLQGVRSRLYGSAVRVCTIRLGPVDTPMTATHKKNALFAKAEEVAQAIVTLEREGPEDAYVPRYWRPIMSAVRGLPERLFQRFAFLAGR